MRPILIVLLSAVVLAQQPPVDQPSPAPAPFVCEDCPDPSRPWMRGTKEIACTTPDKVEEKQKRSLEHVTVVPCEVCRHRCDAFNERAEETGGLAWDPACGTRCSPKGCECKKPCDS